MSEKVFSERPLEVPSMLEKRDNQLKEAIEIFFNYLKIEDQPEKSDAIFILGGSSLEPVKRAAQLYRDGYAQKISFISTGGRFGGEKVWGIPENDKYRELLLELDVPEGAIVSKGLTANTLAEAKAAIPFMKEKGISPKQVILVSRPIHQRRAFATFSQQYPEVKYLNCPADEALDMKDPENAKRLVAEAERLLDYSKKGDIEKQKIPIEVLKAAAKIRMELKRRGEYVFRTKEERLG